MIKGIASQAMLMQMEKVHTEASVRVAKMALDTREMAGNSFIEMLEMNKELYSHVGQNVDALA